jgi:hypothetical protein
MDLQLLIVYPSRQLATLSNSDISFYKTNKRLITHPNNVFARICLIIFLFKLLENYFLIKTI